MNQSNNDSTKLSSVTKNYYENLIGNIGDEYIDFRWKKHPVSRSHYYQTKKSIEYIFSLVNKTADRMLEVGSGPGTWTDICLQHTQKLTIADISSEMLKLVKQRFAHAQIETVCGDYCSEAVKLKGGFDVIFSARALEYMDSKRAMVEKSTTLLNKGGFLIIITKNPLWMDKVREANKDVKPIEDNIQCDWIDWRTLELFYRESGLRNVQTFPVCLGSYHLPLNTFVGIKCCDILQWMVMKKNISPRIEPLAESYITIGQIV